MRKIFLTFISFIAATAIMLNAAETPSLRQTIAAALSSGAKEIKLSAPVYRDDQTLQLLKLKDVSIDGNGATLVQTGLTTAIRIDQCTNVTIRNLTVDYDPLPFTQGVVTNLSADGRGVDFRLDDGYPRLTPKYAVGRMHLFDADGKFWKAKAADLYGTCSILDENRGSFRLNEPEKALNVGDRVALNVRHDYAIYIMDSTATKIENVTLLAAPGLGVIGRFNHGGDRFSHLIIKRGPTPPGATATRLLSTSADGLNYAYSRKGPEIKNCDFSYMGDDSVNLHTVAMPVVGVVNNQTFDTVRPYPYEKFPKIIQPGDRIRLISPITYEIIGEAEITGFRVSPRNYPSSVLSEYYPHGGNAGIGRHTIYEVTIKNPAPELKRGFFFDIPAIAASGFRIVDSYFHDHRGRALRIMASDGMIENNRIERIKHAGISVGGEYGFWREAGWVENMVIRNNQLLDIGYGMLTQNESYTPGAIGVFVRLEDYSGNFRGNRKIEINGNTITNCAGAGIFVNRAESVKINGNHLRNTLDTTGEAGGSKYGFSDAKPIWIIKSAKLVIENNEIK